MKFFRNSFFWFATNAVVIALSTISGWTQDLNPIRWTLKSNVTTIKPGEKFDAQVIATIDEGWHLYSLEQPAGGPIPTRVSIPENQHFKLAGDIESPLPEVIFDPNFNMDTQFFEKEAIFKLPIETAKEASSGKKTFGVNVFFQTCNNQTCLPPKTVRINTEIEIAGLQSSASNTNPGSDSKPNVSNTVSSTPNSNDRAVDFDFIDFKGKQRKFSEFKGKYVLIDFWATWCKPCLADIPKLKELYDKYKSQGFEVLGMDAETLSDDDEAPDPEFAKEQDLRAQQIVKTREVTWTQVVSASAVPLAKKIFKVKALPTKILIDREGNEIARIGEKDDLKGIVEKLLAEKK